MYIVNEKDWKLYRKLVPFWQERYMEKLNKEYNELLSENKTASMKFWQLEKRINIDKRHIGVSIDMRRSNMFTNICILLNEKVISFDDLKEFSEELINCINNRY